MCRSSESRNSRRRWADFLTTQKVALLAKIVKEKALSPELTNELKAAADQFKQTWKK